MIEDLKILAGRYELSEELRRDETGVVFKATDTHLNRTVAINFLPPPLAGDEDYIAHFQEEAQAAARVSNPYIAAVYDSGTEGDQHYLVMEYVQGRTLSEVIAQDGRLPSDRAVGIAEAACEALSAAHEAGIIHGDIRPGNIMLTPNGEVKVMGFGLARTALGPPTVESERMAGVYRAPEQAQVGVVDARSDIYSLGLVLYEMLTGSRPGIGDASVPFGAEPFYEAPIPPSHVAPEMPLGLDEVVLRAVAVLPATRYQSADEFRHDLQNVGVAVVPATLVIREERSSNDRGWLIGALAAASVLALLAILLVVLRNNNEEAAPLVVGQVTVPNVDGMTETAAEAQLNAAGLVLGTVRSAPDAALPGTVFEQDPAANITVARGSAVDVWIASTAAPVETVESFGTGAVPSVQGMSESSATDAIVAAGFTVGTISRTPSATVPARHVISQDPQAGTQYQPGSAVGLTISTGPSTVVVPDLTCETTSNADSNLAALGLELKVLFPTSPNPACPTAGRVGSQDTPAGTTVAPGTTIVVHVSGR